MLRTTLKSVLGHKSRLVSTMLAVLLGVGFLAGTLVLTDTITKSFDAASENAYADADAVVRQPAAFTSATASSDQRGRVDASLVDTVAGVDGVAVAEGRVSGYARLVDGDGDLLGNPDGGAPTLGGNWSDTASLNPFDLAVGAAPSADDEVVIDRGSAKDGDIEVGDTVTVLALGAPQQMRVTGIATYGGDDSPAGASWSLFNTETAQRLVAQPGQFDSVVALADDGVSPDELADRISAVVPDQEVLTGSQITAETRSDARSELQFFNVFMTIFAVIALLVGSFIIFNTFSITVAQRTRENALLRAIGGTRRQIRRLGPLRGAVRRDRGVGGRRRDRRRRGQRPQGDAVGVRLRPPGRLGRPHAAHRDRGDGRRHRDHDGRGPLPGAEGGEGAADRGAARRRGRQHRLRLDGHACSSAPPCSRWASPRSCWASSAVATTRCRWSRPGCWRCSSGSPPSDARSPCRSAGCSAPRCRGCGASPVRWPARMPCATPSARRPPRRPS